MGTTHRKQPVEERHPNDRMVAKYDHAGQGARWRVAAAVISGAVSGTIQVIVDILRNI